MRKVFLMMAACCMLASPVLADGGVDLYGSYAKVLDGENSYGIGGRFSLGGDNWMFDIGATWYKKVEDAEVVDDPEAQRDDFKFAPYDLGLRYIFFDGHKLRPYVGGGISYIDASSPNLRINGAFGIYALAGLRFGKQPGINFMADLLYRWAELDVRYGLVESRDVTVGGLGLNVGISFIF
jgi:hypothetical protein